MTAALTPEQRIEALMDVVDDYAEARHVFGHRTYNQKTELARKKVAQRIEALEAELAALRDSECDKIMAMSETQINALTRIQGSNPEDIAQLGRMTARAAIKDVEINRLREELAAAHTVKRDIVKAYYKMYNAAAGYSNYCEDSASVRRCERDFDEGHKLFIAAMAAGEKAS